MGTRCGWLLKPLQQEAMIVKVKMGPRAQRLRFQPPRPPPPAGRQGFQAAGPGCHPGREHPGTAQTQLFLVHWTPYYTGNRIYISGNRQLANRSLGFIAYAWLLQTGFMSGATTLSSVQNARTV